MSTHCLTAKVMKCLTCEEAKDCDIVDFDVACMNGCEFVPKDRSSKATVADLLNSFQRVKFCGNVFMNGDLLASFKKGKYQISRCFSDATLSECYVDNVKMRLLNNSITITWDLTACYN